MTLKTIAKHFNLSVSTISRALRDDASISAETRAKIQAFARENHFKVNSNAANLRKKQSHVIGVILPEISSYFFSNIIDGMEEIADQHNYSIIITQTNEGYEKERKSVHSLIGLRVAGILISMAKETERFEHYQDILENQIPLLFFDRICTGILTDKVVVNDYRAAFEAVSYLIATGCKRIALFGSESKMEIAKQRRMGYEDALRAHQMKVDTDLIYDCDTEEKTKILMPQILKQPDRPDAFLAINDATAAAILYVSKRSGLRIPEDISVCGFGNGYIAKNTDPLLTSIDQFPVEIGRVAMRIMIEKIENPDSRGKITNKIIHTKLVPKESTRTL